MMNFDPESLDDLASGRLPPAEAAAVEAALLPEARAELALQKAVRSQLLGLGGVRLTEMEQARLVRGLQTATRQRVEARRVRWSSRLAIAAILLVASGGTLYTLNGVLGGSEDDSAAVASRSNRDGADAVLTQAATTTMAPAALGLESARTLSEATTQVLTAEEIMQLRRETPLLDFNPASATLANAQCFAEASANPNRVPVADHEREIAGARFVIFIYASDDPDGPHLQIYDPETCALAGSSFPE